MTQTTPISDAPQDQRAPSAAAEAEALRPAPWAPSTLPRRWLGFHPTAVPLAARANYRHELTAMCLLPFMIVAFEGSALSVLVRIAFEGRVDRGLLNAVTAFLAVSPALANLSSAVWAPLAQGVDKVRFITSLQRWMILLAAVIAVMPRTALGLMGVALASLVARCCWTGILTIRSTVWKANYPDGARGRITGKFAAVQVTLVALLALGLGKAMEHAEWSFRALLLIGCVLALAGNAAWGRIRVRRHAALRRAEQHHTPTLRHGVGALWSALSRDGQFARFMVFQFLLGLGNIMAGALLPIVLRETFEVGYLWGLALNTSIPLLCMPLTVPLWARLIDRTHAVHFRAIHSWVFVVGLTALTIGIRQEWLWLVGLAVAIKGVAFGGGALAWNLGHLDFAPPGQASTYMGVHVTLTGMRGLVSWLLGLTLYESFERGSPGAGWVVFAMCAGVTTLGAIGFVMMSRRMGRRGRGPSVHHEDVEAAPTQATS